jgi:hypothetical protein
MHGKYADDCTQYHIVERDTCSSMQEAVDGLNGWADTNKMALNPRKTKDMWICFTAPSQNHLASKLMTKK